MLIWVVFGVQIAWFGLETTGVTFRDELRNIAVSYTVVSVIVIAAWMAMLAIYDSRSYRVAGTGSREYKLVANASMRVFGLVAIIAFLFHIDLARGYVLLAFPFGMFVLLLSRWIWRQWLGVQRQRGNYSSRVLLVGSVASVVHIARQFARQPAAGFRVIGACVPGDQSDDVLPGTAVPIFGNVSAVEQVLASTGADTVVITSAAELPPERVSELSWSLEPGRQHLVMAPNLTNISGPRIHTRPVAGLPLIHVETPKYEGRILLTKRVFDIVISTILIILLSPLLAVIAVLIRSQSPGTILFRQARIGLNGQTFTMLKFRSMVPDAEELLIALQEQQRAVGNTVMFKMRDDPRVTPLGKFLRRYSLDELPQLFNVFMGSMSLVGPRPSLEREAESYEMYVRRRFLVKPGITGLWQISGRSNLSWEDTVRLDLYYVENWSILGDLVILWRTAKAVMASEGAY